MLGAISSCFSIRAPLARSTLEGFTEHEKLDLVIDGQYTGTSDTAENVGTSTFEEGPNTFLGNDLAASVEGRLILDSLGTFNQHEHPKHNTRHKLTSPEVIIIRRRIVSRG